jgi:hypothetical protein
MVPTTRGQTTSGMSPFDTVEYLVADVMSLSKNVVTALKDAGEVTVADMLSLDNDAINDLELFLAHVQFHANFLAFSNIILPSTAEQYNNT